MTGPDVNLLAWPLAAPPVVYPIAAIPGLNWSARRAAAASGPLAMAAALLAAAAIACSASAPSPAPSPRPPTASPSSNSQPETPSPSPTAAAGARKASGAPAPDAAATAESPTAAALAPATTPPAPTPSGAASGGDAARNAYGVSADPGYAESLAASRVRTAVWETDFRFHTAPYEEILSGGVGRDGIPPIDNPSFVSAGAAGEWLADAEPVIALEHGGEAKAYPLQVLIWHEIVNDEIAGLPVAATYCPLWPALATPRSCSSERWAARSTISASPATSATAI